MKKDDCFFFFNLFLRREKKQVLLQNKFVFHYKNLSLTVDSKVYDSIQLAIDTFFPNFSRSGRCDFVVFRWVCSI